METEFYPLIKKVWDTSDQLKISLPGFAAIHAYTLMICDVIVKANAAIDKLIFVVRNPICASRIARYLKDRSRTINSGYHPGFQSWYVRYPDGKEVWLVPRECVSALYNFYIRDIKIWFVNVY